MLDNVANCNDPQPMGTNHQNQVVGARLLLFLCFNTLLHPRMRAQHVIYVGTYFIWPTTALSRVVSDEIITERMIGT